jgi:hypothetical protein
MSVRLLRGDVRSVLDRIAATRLQEYDRILEAQWEERYDLPVPKREALLTEDEIDAALQWEVKKEQEAEEQGLMEPFRFPWSGADG